MQNHRADELHHQTFGASTHVNVDLTSVIALTLSAPLAQVGLGGNVPIWTPQDPFSIMADDSNNNALSNAPSLEMDWHVWDEIAEKLEPSLDF